MKKGTHSLAAVAIAGAFAVTGCTSGPVTIGDQIRGEGQEYASIAKDWQRGQAKVDKGENMLKAAEKERKQSQKAITREQKDIRDAERTIEKAQKLVAEGKKQQRTAIADYEGTKGDAVSPPPELSGEEAETSGN